jgi:hypothetical protein
VAGEVTWWARQCVHVYDPPRRRRDVPLCYKCGHFDMPNTPPTAISRFHRARELDPAERALADEILALAEKLETRINRARDLIHSPARARLFALAMTDLESSINWVKQGMLQS